METKLRRWGNSQGILIPKTLLAKLNIDNPDNQSVELEFQDGKLTITKATNKSKIDQLFEGFDTDSYFDKYGEPHEALSGDTVGKELI
ncbi:AbrB/MazE/SpoVT family DNA-binding domain-containing protein [Lacticaseibacillus hulanensis]|uniref:AbrB/MazE/SpoVT family DNA-binding domain-containing protein n=1 Tax=Lacticaseibacillus hulanensis TaxID=2493111 RepID=UPI000FDC1E44|nr:AbrB/MazE/SpoVT family DNA-binding domain-containing protein [Lacticaseibacillus hulanensis]